MYGYCHFAFRESPLGNSYVCSRYARVELCMIIIFCMIL